MTDEPPFQMARDESERDGRGRFARGWRGGPGNPNVARLGAAQRVVRRHATPRRIGLVLQQLLGAALDGDVQAARVWLDRVLGRAPEQVQEPVPLALDLPDLRDAASCAEALRNVVAGVAAGTLPIAAAHTVATLVVVARDSIALRDLAVRLVALEQREEPRW